MTLLLCFSLLGTFFLKFNDLMMTLLLCFSLLGMIFFGIRRPFFGISFLVFLDSFDLMMTLLVCLSLLWEYRM